MRQIWEGLRANNVELVIALIREYPRATKEEFASCSSLLHVAAEVSSCDMLAALIAEGMSIAEERCGGFTPLHNASNCGNLENVRWLLRQGAEIDAGNGRVATPMCSAAMEGNIEVVKFLVDQGANINATYLFGSQTVNALAMTSSFGLSVIAEFLEERGATLPQGMDKTASAETKRRPPTELDLRKDKEKLAVFLESSIAEYLKPLRKSLVSAIDIRFSLEHGMVDISFCEALDYEPGKYALEPFRTLQCIHWADALGNQMPTRIILPTGKQLQAESMLFLDAKLLCRLVGDMLVKLLLELRRRRVFEPIPQHVRCEIGVEEIGGEFGWPENAKRGQSNLI